MRSRSAEVEWSSLVGGRQQFSGVSGSQIERTKSMDPTVNVGSSTGMEQQSAQFEAPLPDQEFGEGSPDPVFLDNIYNCSSHQPVDYSSPIEATGLVFNLLVDLDSNGKDSPIQVHETPPEVPEVTPPENAESGKEGEG